MTTSVVLAILVTSLATFSSRFIGVITSEKIKENSKIFRWFNCLAYSTLAALIARVVIFPSGVLSEVDYLVRIIVIISSIIVFYLTKKNLVYPTVFSAIILALINSY
jgi:branched-subunit amino acid transport protein|tara:strand:- start:216 stop:536 length:321 start_codon:yes stop_codon:yes gene_type:complete